MNVVRVELDLFPVQVYTDKLLVADARAVLADGRLLVWSMSTGQKQPGPPPYRHVDALVTRRSVADNNDVILSTDVDTYRIVRQGSCGCGNPMRSWKPFPNERVERIGFEVTPWDALSEK